METIKAQREQAENKFIGCEKLYYDDEAELLSSRLSFRAGWSAAVEELLRWRDPKEELPEERRAVLVKTDVDINIGFYFGHGEFSVGDIGTGLVDRKDEDEDSYLILGWRPIVELPEDGEKEG